MTKALYIDCVGGVAGDMLLAGLVHAGADVHYIRDYLSELGLGIEVRVTERHGITANSVSIELPTDQVHRNWEQVKTIIDELALPERACRRAQHTFAALAKAEGKVHNADPRDVTFHEVGALDAIADICGVALAVESLEVDTVRCSPVPLSRGYIAATHGVLPLPAPAVIELLRGVPVYGIDLGEELVTPTGAALVTSLAADFGPIPSMTLLAAGYGAGARELDAIPNVVRILVGETHSLPLTDLVLLETNLDDMPSELVPDAVVACVSAGALDSWTTPITMKKGRPGLVLAAVARPEEQEGVALAMLRHTTTLGVRRHDVSRWELERHTRTVEVAGQPIRVKIGLLDGRVVNASPEHDDCARVAIAARTTTKQVWARAFAAAQELTEWP